MVAFLHKPGKDDYTNAKAIDSLGGQEKYVVVEFCRKYINFLSDIKSLDTVICHFASKGLGASSCGMQVLFICIILLYLENFIIGRRVGDFESWWSLDCLVNKHLVSIS